MRTLAAVVIATALAVPAFAQEIDYSREELNRVFSMHQIDLPPRPAPNVRYGFGYVEFRALGMDWRLIYLPIAMPLSGTETDVTQTLPDPFALTGAHFATTPQQWHTQRQVNREIRRIKKTDTTRLSVRKQ
ncbi:MAG TPA: hypothetical protein VEK57_14100 [Thermoanaerobaculia bacterium]|nr:hypothetical protein [Thermoanaerobaculia bacterium]